MNRALRIRRNRPDILKLPDIYKYGYNDGIAFAEKQFKKKQKEKPTPSNAELTGRELENRLTQSWNDGVTYGRANPAGSRLSSIEGGLMIFGLISGLMFGVGLLINLFATDYVETKKLILLALMSIGCFQVRSTIEIKRILR
jgi:hypothetical protein